MAVQQVAIGGGFWLAPAAAAWFARANRQLTAAFGFGMELSTLVIGGKKYLSGAGRTPAEQKVINRRQTVSDHVLGRAIDINNHRRFRNINEGMFLAILAENGWHNIQVNGRPFPEEPWHFANWSATGPQSAPANRPHIPAEKEEDDMRFAIIWGAQTGDAHPYLYDSEDGKRRALTPVELSIERIAGTKEVGGINQTDFDAIAKKAGSV